MGYLCILGYLFISGQRLDLLDQLSASSPTPDSRLDSKLRIHGKGATASAVLALTISSLQWLFVRRPIRIDQWVEY